MKGLWLIIFLLLFNLTLSAQHAERASLQFQLDAGYGAFLGNFRDHLQQSGAYSSTPVLEGSLLIYPGEHWGLGMLLGSMTVIHPQSEPIEGIIRYQELLLEYRLDKGAFWGLLYAGAGFQDPGMTLQWYGSGVADFGIRGGYRIKNGLSMTLTLGYRRSFLRSIIIADQYGDIDSMDNLSSLRINLGLRYSTD